MSLTLLLLSERQHLGHPGQLEHALHRARSRLDLEGEPVARGLGGPPRDEVKTRRIHEGESAQVEDHQAEPRLDQPAQLLLDGVDRGHVELAAGSYDDAITLRGDLACERLDLSRQRLPPILRWRTSATSQKHRAPFSASRSTAGPRVEALSRSSIVAPDRDPDHHEFGAACGRPSRRADGPASSGSPRGRWL